MTAQCEVCRGILLELDIVGEQILRCRDCGHVERPYPGLSTRQQVYGGVPERDELRTELTFRRIKRAIGGRPYSSVFEVGFGDGGLLRRFFDDGMEIAGCDPGANQVGIDSQVSRFGTLFHAPLEEIPTDVHADVVVAIHVVEHLPEAVPALDALLNIVRPGGLLFITTPTADCVPFDVFGGSWWMLEDPTHVRFYSEQSLRLGLVRDGVTVAITRPRLDSIGSDGASLVTKLRHLQGADPTLTQATGRFGSLAIAPVALGFRSLHRRARPVLDATVRVK